MKRLIFPLFIIISLFIGADHQPAIANVICPVANFTVSPDTHLILYFCNIIQYNNQGKMKKYKKITKIFKTKNESIKEARRYYQNAKQTLRKSKNSGGRYQDVKYVRDASGMAYLSALMAIDGYLIQKGTDTNKLPKNISEYYRAIAKLPKDGKLNTMLNNVYDDLHVWGYYRGMQSVKIINVAFGEAKELIDYLAK